MCNDQNMFEKIETGKVTYQEFCEWMDAQRAYSFADGESIARQDFEDKIVAEYDIGYDEGFKAGHRAGSIS